VDPGGTVPESWRVTDWPAAREARDQESVAGVKVTPFGRLGLATLEKPWDGRASTTLRFDASDGPLLETTIV
jgi:hypothetical protein